MKPLLLLLLILLTNSCSTNNIDPDSEEPDITTAQNDTVANKPKPNDHGGINDWKTDTTEYETDAHPIN